MKENPLTVLYGEAFELGVKAGLASKAYQLPDGYDVEDFEDALLEGDDTLLEMAREIAGESLPLYNYVLEKGLDRDARISRIVEVFRKKQVKRALKFSIDGSLLANTDVANILSLLQMGYRTGKILGERYETFLLEAPVGYSLGYLYPDFIAFNGRTPVAIGDFKVLFGYFDADLTNVAWSVSFETYSMEELLTRVKRISGYSFKTLYNAAGKYAKVLNYARKFDRFPIEAVVVFPLGISILELGSFSAIGEYYSKLLELLEKMMPESFMEHAREILDGFYTGNAFIKYDETSGTFYFHKKSKDKGIQLRWDKRPIQQNMGHIKTPRPFYIGVMKRRLRHEKDLMKYLEEFDLIIDASDQGAGKNYVFLRYASDVVSNGGKVLFISPRLHILSETKRKLERNGIKTLLVSSSARRKLKKRKTYVETLEAPKTGTYQASRKLLGSLRTEEPGVVLATSQAFQYLNPGSWKSVLKYTDLVVFDEFTNSGAGAVESTLSFLRTFSRNPRGTKVAILDASMTHPGLYVDTFKKHLSSRGMVYTPLEVLVSRVEEDPAVREFKVNSIRAVYYRIHLDFPLEYYAMGLGVHSQIPDWNAVIAGASELLGEREVNLENLLKDGKVVFYVDNRLYVDDLTEFLVERGYPTTPVHSEIGLSNEELGGNVVGTSSLAFGVNLENHDVLVFISPYPGYRHDNNAYGIELYRQVIKRLRGYEGGKKHVIFVGLTGNDENYSEGVAYLSLVGFIRNLLLNRDFHIRLPMFSGGGRFFKPSGGNMKPGESREVSFEAFMRDYYPSLKRLFMASGFSLRPVFKFEFALSEDWELPVPFRVHRITGEYVANNFTLEVLPLRVQFDHVERFQEVLADRKYRRSAELLRNLVPKIDEYLSSVKNEHELARKLEKALRPSYILAGYSSLLLVPFLYPLHVDEIPHGIDSPLKRLFFGESRYTEIPVKVVEKDKGVENFGILAIHPVFGMTTGRRDVPVQEKLRMAMVEERLRKNRFYLPNVWKGHDWRK
ncbi:hypothetical protein [Thermococcus camini]|uniref:Superfamily II DNA or RNA helicase n=1 Tax=Thermococcus camini TaxID=2016373 RepID=A0A7G2DA83_9EURY|nr:hypothetical protein [Thermococcus camini]CAD5244830.1 Superfamily II DNA or RNA helicase [Thermococcus camini]